MQTDPEYWFPAKRYGWGWGIPNTWQGWLVLAVFGALLAAGSVVLPPDEKWGCFWPMLLYFRPCSLEYVGSRVNRCAGGGAAIMNNARISAELRRQPRYQ